MPAEIKLSEGGDKDQIAFSLLPHFPSFNGDFYHCAYAVRSHGGKMFLSLCLCFFGGFLSPENHLRDTISTGHTESCHTLTYTPTHPVAGGSAHPQLLVTPSGRWGVGCAAPRLHLAQKCSFPFLPLAKEEDTLCTYHFELLWLVLKLLDIIYTFVIILWNPTQSLKALLGQLCSFLSL